MKSIIFSSCLIVALMSPSSAQINLQQGLVGYYSFSGNANDSSALAINGTVHGAVLTTGVNNTTNSAYSFTAANNDYIDFGSNNRGITNRVTVSLWLKTSSAAKQYPFTKYDGFGDGGYLIGMQNGQVTFDGRDGNNTYYSTGYSSTSINDGQWHHILGMVDVNSWKLYIDCNLEASFTTTSGTVNLANSDVMTVGRWFTGGINNDHWPFDGAIDEVRVYNRALTSSELQLLCSEPSCQTDLQQGLVGSYALTGNPDDGSSLAINGTVHGAVLTNGVMNDSNSAYSFTATNNDYIDFGSNNRGITNRVTVSLWLKTTSAAQQYPFIKYTGTGDAGYLITMLNGKVYFAGRDGNNTFITTGSSVSAINDGQWHHVMGVVDVNSWKLYIDCNLEAQFTSSSNSVNLANGDIMAIGRWFTGDPNGNHFPFTGSIDNLLIYNRALTSCESETLCGETSCQIDLQQELVGYYPLISNPNDASSLAINGTVHGAVLTTGVMNDANAAYSFAAANNDYIDLGTNNRGITDKVTVSIWLKTTSTSKQYPFTKYVTSAGGYLFGMLNGKISFDGRDGNTTYHSTGYSSISINDGQWHHVMGVVDVNSWRLYVDCNLEASYTSTSSSVNLANNDVMSIGRWYTGDPNGNRWPFNGSIDELRIYNRILTSCELEILCNPATANGNTLIVTVSSTPASCGLSDGTATVTASGGSGDYSYAWSHGTGADSVLTGLPSGTYSVTVTDDSTGVIAIARVDVHYAYETTSTLSSNAVCLGDTTHFTLTNSDSLVSWLYIFSNGTSSTQQNPSITFSYCPPADNWARVVVTNAHGCKDTLINHAVVNCPVYASYYGQASTKCAGECNGTASINVTQGTSPFSIQWSDPQQQTTATAANLCAGTYTVSVTDANGCSTMLPAVEVYSPDSFIGVVSIYNITCHGETGGTAVLFMNGGTSPYGYSWNDAANTATNSITGLTAGTYCVTAADEHGCTFDTCVTIIQPSEVTITATTNNPACGVCNGSAAVTASGGVAPYLYSWSSGSSTANATGLCAGAHYVDITDASGCTKRFQISLSNNNGPTVAISTTNVLCYGACTGSVTATSGCGSCTFALVDEDGVSLGSNLNLCAGDYTLIATDQTSGCITATSFTISQPDAIIPITSAIPASAIGACDGSASVVASGGVPPYSYEWADSQNILIPGATSTLLGNLCTGTYYVRITDANNCQSAWTSATVNEPQGLTLTAESVTAPAGSQVVVPITVKSFQNIAGAQGSIQFDPQVISYMQTEQYGLPGMSTFNFGTSQVATGVLSFIWDDPSTVGISIADGSVIFALRFNVTGSAGQQSDVDFVNSPTILEFIDPQANPVSATFISGVVTIEPPIAVSGFIRSEDGQPVPAVKVTLTGQSTQTVTGGTDGSYTFSVSQGGSCVITPSKDNDVTKNNGLTTADILLTRRHILGSQLLPTPYKIIAADVNGSNNVSTQDVLLMRSVILNNTSFPNGRLWSFLPSDYVFSNPASPFPYPSSRTYASISSNLTDQNFTGIKLGDVNNTWDHNILKTGTETVQFVMNEQHALPGEEVVVPVTVKDFKNVSGYQFTLSWDAEVLEMLEVTNKKLNGYYGIGRVTEGYLTTSWNEDLAREVTLDNDEIVFEIKFKVKGEIGSSSEINIGSELTAAEAYNENIELLSIVSTNGFVKVGQESSIINGQSSTINLAVQPNPFSNSTKIIFSIPKDETVSIEIYDIFGKQVSLMKAEYKTGEHTMKWQGNDDHGNHLSKGLYHVRMVAGENSKAVKVVLAE